MSTSVNRIDNYRLSSHISIEGSELQVQPGVLYKNENDCGLQSKGFKKQAWLLLRH